MAGEKNREKFIGTMITWHEGREKTGENVTWTMRLWLEGRDNSTWTMRLWHQCVWGNFSVWSHRWTPSNCTWTIRLRCKGRGHTTQGKYREIGYNN